MRNCFVPGCDQYHKGSKEKRAMFNVPIKYPELLEQWRQALPKHRPLKEFDRVCEAHFSEDDILRYWEHTINGVVERMLRAKPSLKPTAVPNCFQPEISDRLVSKIQETTDQLSPSVKKAKRKALDIEEGVRKRKSSPSKNLVIAEESNEEAEENYQPPGGNEPSVVIQMEEEILGPVSETVHPKFEVIYDDVYEVELPSVLWGIHRDPEKKFICFTEFSQHTMSCSKYLYLDQVLDFRMAVGQRVTKRGTLDDPTTETITELLRSLDGIKIRKVIIKGSSSLNQTDLE
ncbi:uncharacterized protein LOC129740212 [Uranotaenia lowii]|uniref:uncharacterized protein LOC129740212 n=1 Tax=Uranotaenia lowii TaxID=190385 RepID=UPI00247859F2|nr:uncharacterized protein LOC129740212 [Uranotaenia lowii]